MEKVLLFVALNIACFCLKNPCALAFELCGGFHLCKIIETICGLGLRMEQAVAI